jgi:DNA-binding CsgD family transcriptional regulator
LFIESDTLTNRRRECEAIDALIADMLAGRSRVIVLRGEAGIGKSALLAYLSRQAADWRIARAAGVESEAELAYSGLHQLCGSMLDQHLDGLPTPQRNALATVFGLSAGPPPDPFLVGLATLSLFAEIAETQPLVCIVDDAHWLDRASAQIIGFVGRRLLAERVALVCAARKGIGDGVLAGLPAVFVDGLGDAESRSLLLEHLNSPLDVAILDQIVADSHGNPLALLELPRGLTATELAGGFGVMGATGPRVRVEESFLRRLEGLPADTRSAVLVAAADPVGDPTTLWRALALLGIEASAATAAESAGLLAVASQVRFRHPLVRSTAYAAAGPDERRAAHLAVAKSTDREADPDRRAWHLAMASTGPDENVAIELERSAVRAQARGGIAAAAAFLERAVALTADPGRRGERAIAAGQASFQAGAFDAALALLAAAESGPLDGFQRARIDLLRAHVAFATSLGREAPPMLLLAAKQLEGFDVELARETYLVAWAAAGFAGSLSERDVLFEICRSAQALPSSDSPTPLAHLLDGLTLLTLEGHDAAADTLHKVATRMSDVALGDLLRWGWMAYAASAAVMDVDGMYAIASGQLSLARAAGALAQLPLYLNALCLTVTWMGDLAMAESLVAEIHSVAAVTGSSVDPSVELRLVSLQGRSAEATVAIDSVIDSTGGSGQGLAERYAHWAAAVLHNGFGRYEEATSEAQKASIDTVFPWPAIFALPELVEAATRTGNLDLASDALQRLSAMTQPSGGDVALGIESRSRALLSQGATADALYQESIERLRRTTVRPELARAHLLYGEWLRRERRRSDARTQLRAAHQLLDEIGMEAFAERARRELLATGEQVRRRGVDPLDTLTPQEQQIARLARDGLSNVEIGAMLFVSPRTVEWHLRNVFTKVDITSRRELRSLLWLPQRPSATT